MIRADKRLEGIVIKPRNEIPNEKSIHFPITYVVMGDDGIYRAILPNPSELLDWSVEDRMVLDNPKYPIKKAIMISPMYRIPTNTILINPETQGIFQDKKGVFRADLHNPRKHRTSIPLYNPNNC